jgi:uncharacterized protein
VLLGTAPHPFSKAAPLAPAPAADDLVSHMSKERTLITGASSGIGLELARQFAKHGHSLVLTARIESELQEIARELEQAHGVSVRVIARDLEKPGAEQEIFDFAALDPEPVEILVNDAGLGQRGRFWEIPQNAIHSMIRVNIESMVNLTRLFLPEMIQRGRGRILNVASVAGFEPGPLMATYHATKAFVLSFTESLVVELEKTGVVVTALCPGATDTDFIPKADMLETRLFQSGNVMAPQQVAKEGYDALMRGNPLYVVGGMNKAQVFSRRFLTKTTLARISKKMYEDAPPQKQGRRHRGDVETAEEHTPRKAA